MDKTDQKWRDAVNQYANEVIELKQQNAELEEQLVLQEEFTNCEIHGTLIEYFTDCPDCMDAEFYANLPSAWEMRELEASLKNE